MPSDTQKGYALAVIAILMWSTSEIVQKLWQRLGYQPLTLGFFRYFVGAFSILIIMTFQKDFKGMGGMLRRNWKLFLISSAFATAVGNYIYFVGMQLTQANIGSAIYTSYPIYVTIYSMVILNEKNNMRRKIIGLVLGFAGVAILVTNFDLTGFWRDENFLGNILVLIGSLTWSLYSVIGKKIQRCEAALGVTNADVKFNFLSMVIAAITSGIPLIFLPEGATLFQYSIDGWTLILIMGFITTGWGFYVFFLAVKKIEVSQAISLAYIKPIMTIIFAFWLLSEVPTPALLVAIPVIFASIVIINWHAKESKNPFCRPEIAIVPPNEL
ncbi:MAG TPA: DMT family transporter [Candidatus Lokiarchaeia archaeon]|nr:DMT family transporter [Candidatus Lokiarchaeia archaeon]